MDDMRLIIRVTQAENPGIAQQVQEAKKDCNATEHFKYGLTVHSVLYQAHERQIATRVQNNDRCGKWCCEWR